MIHLALLARVLNLLKLNIASTCNMFPYGDYSNIILPKYTYMFQAKLLNFTLAKNSTYI